MSALAKDICNITVSRSDLACPICRETIHDVYSAPCGHSFCYECIVQNLQHRPLCPCCSSYMTKDNLYPNALLDKVRPHKRTQLRVPWVPCLLSRFEYRAVASQSCTSLLLNQLVRNAELVGKLQKGSALERLKHTVTSNSLDLSVLDIEELQKILQDTKRRLAIEDTQTELLMLKSFLSQTK